MNHDHFREGIYDCRFRHIFFACSDSVWQEENLNSSPGPSMYCYCTVAQHSLNHWNVAPSRDALTTCSRRLGGTCTVLFKIVLVQATESLHVPCLHILVSSLVEDLLAPSHSVVIISHSFNSLTGKWGESESFWFT
jgi:hypothetical protein